MTEFELIESCFRSGTVRDASLMVGNGDDCLVWHDAAPLAMSIDTAVAGRHFPEDASPERVAQRAFLPALSDLAAMGATPAFFTLALTLPTPIDEHWTRRFAQRLVTLADHYGLVLAGGDTTSGPARVISLQMHGRIAQPLTRSGVLVGDEVWVSGQPGRAAAALPAILDGREADVPGDWLDAYWQPQPRLSLGQQLVGIANAAIDVSDGLVADLTHLARASHLNIELAVEHLPVAPSLSERLGFDDAIAKVLAGGDDYELAFTAPAERHNELLELSQQLALPLTCIGRAQAGDATVSIRHNGKDYRSSWPGFTHF
ncbi:thiamine-phosphate kinase [Saccharospirillum sp. MSK14-1]|uniref:thiamine-phosphate kinase n=1 Tax=Saccharospirillum sp. MSK14-1 TaxID=1897632 RepID=UPI000D362A3C|nr:thiamine-phosphate kinase [Saccharospirillum sp. MSK14-1]PTY38224.1 thiamine-phosphate kinase [Saccharospirillum sp. MSK14-1]